MKFHLKEMASPGFLASTISFQSSPTKKQKLIDKIREVTKTAVFFYQVMSLSNLNETFRNRPDIRATMHLILTIVKIVFDDLSGPQRLMIEDGELRELCAPLENRLLRRSLVR